MSFLEQRASGQYHLVFRFGGKRFKKAMKTNRMDVVEAMEVWRRRRMRCPETQQPGT